MFNARTLNIIRISMKIYSALGSTPLTWDSDGGHISVCETGRRKVTFFMAVVHIFVHLCFLFWRLGQLSRERNPSFQTAVWLWIWIMLGFWHLVTSYNGWTKKWEVVALFKGVKLLTGKLEKGTNFKNRAIRGLFGENCSQKYFLELKIPAPVIILIILSSYHSARGRHGSKLLILWNLQKISSRTAKNFIIQIKFCFVRRDSNFHNCYSNTDRAEITT